MAERTLIARVREDGRNAGTWIVASPVVGLADGIPGAGVFLNRYDSVVTVRILGRAYVLRLPRDLQGWVVQTYIGSERTPVAFDEPLVRLDPRVEVVPEAVDAARGGAGLDEAADLAGAIVVKAPTDGVFYRRPSPEAPAFVEAGTAVRFGTVLGMIEVMKCFNQIPYGGAGLPPEGEVARILVEDGAEVKFGQPLFWIRLTPRPASPPSARA